jgi:hypothetical protein
VIIWTVSTGDAGSADTRARAAQEATDTVLAHWAAHHPRTGGAEGITICVDDAQAYVGPGITADGVYDVEATTVLLHQMRDHLATTIDDDHEPPLP